MSHKKLRGKKCQQCGSKFELQFHHVRYDIPDVGVTLCVTCHEQVHSYSWLRTKPMRDKKIYEVRNKKVIPEW